jgi:hypothetical protein
VDRAVWNWYRKNPQGGVSAHKLVATKRTAMPCIPPAPRFGVYACRPIDGINVADHLLGKSAKSGREAVLYFGLDGRLMSVKWKNFKVIFRKSDGIGEPITDVQVPMVFNLIGDPGERFNLWEVSLDMGWVYRPVFEQIARFGQSVARYPNVKTGEEFKGYKK